jgi:hypothetical protein
MNIVRYDGTRFITEDEIDREFTDQWVLISVKNEHDALTRKGFLVATAEGKDELRSVLSDIAITEFDSKATIIYGCKTRGDDLHVQLLG